MCSNLVGLEKRGRQWFHFWRAVAIHITSSNHNPLEINLCLDWEMTSDKFVERNFANTHRTTLTTGESSPKSESLSISPPLLPLTPTMANARISNESAEKTRATLRGSDSERKRCTNNRPELEERDRNLVGIYKKCEWLPGSDFSCTRFWFRLFY